MSAQRFSTGQQFCWNGQRYEIRQLLGNHQLDLVNLQTQTSQTVPFLHLYQALLADELQFMGAGQPTPTIPPHPYLDLVDCPADLRAVAEYRLAIIRPFLELSPSQRKQAIEAQVEELKAQHQAEPHTLHTAISVASVYRWLRDYTHSGGDLRALIPNTHKRGGKKKSRLPAAAEATISATIDDFCPKPEQTSLDVLHREVAVRIVAENRHRLPEEQLPIPSRATIGRRLWAQPQSGQPNVQPAGRQYAATDYPTLPLARVEIDHTRSDLIVIDEADLLPLGRLGLTYCLDTATRYPLGYYLSFEPPSYLSVMACLYHAILPKTNVPQQYGTQHEWTAHGIPFTLIVDNAKEFIGADLDDACHCLGIGLERMPVRTPYFKAAVERLIGTANTGLFHTLPGTTFANPGQRGDYESLKQACISQNDLETIMHTFMVDIYAEDFHRGLSGIPARRWEEATRAGFFPRVPTSAKELQILLGRVAYRTILPYGLELYSLRYNCPALTSLRTRMLKREPKQVKVKYLPTDLSRVYVYDPDEHQYLEVPALAQAYTQGLSLWKHRVIHNFVLNEQRTVDIVALGQAQRKIQAIVEKSLTRKKLQTRTKVARWQGQSSDPSEPPPPPPAALAVAEPTPPPTQPDLDLDLAELEKKGWALSYA